MKRKKIGIFSGYFPPHVGGVERYAAGLSEALARLGYDVIVVTFNDSGAQSHERGDSYAIYRLPVLNTFKARYPLPKLNAEYRSLIDQIDAEAIDYYILNTRFHLTSLIGAKMAKRNGKPVLLIEHGTNHLSIGNKYLDFLGRGYEHALTAYVKRFVDGFYGDSKACNVWLQHFSISASGVFYMAVDPDYKIDKDTYDKEYPSEIVITYAGRLLKEKGVLNLVEAFQRLESMADTSRARLVIAGDGPLLSSLKNGHKNGSIDVLGRLDRQNVMSLLRRTDIFVYPSLYPEGLPASIMEAGMMGCAIVATPRGGTEEVIRDREHGRIVDGSVSSLYEALAELIADPAERATYADRARQRVKTHFTWDSVAVEVDDELKRLSLGT